jgi:nitrogen-specific signal transduction histidine kinase
MACPHQLVSYSVDLQQIIDNLPISIIVLSRDGKILLANKKAVSFANMPRENLLGLHFGNAFGCADSEKNTAGCGYTSECKACEIHRTVLETFEAREGKVFVETEMKLTVMGRVPVRLSTNFLDLKIKELVILTIEDISEQKIQNEIRIENSRLISAARTVAAVCNEMSQPLVAMAGFVDLLLTEGQEDDSTRKLVEDVRSQASRLAEVTVKLMNARAK